MSVRVYVVMPDGRVGLKELEDRVIEALRDGAVAAVYPELLPPGLVMLVDEVRGGELNRFASLLSFAPIYGPTLFLRERTNQEGEKVWTGLERTDIFDVQDRLYGARWMGVQTWEAIL